MHDSLGSLSPSDQGSDERAEVNHAGRLLGGANTHYSPLDFLFVGDRPPSYIIWVYWLAADQPMHIETEQADSLQHGFVEGRNGSDKVSTDTNIYPSITLVAAIMASSFLLPPPLVLVPRPPCLPLLLLAPFLLLLLLLLLPLPLLLLLLGPPAPSIRYVITS
jgi:hypothetical protein